MLCPSRTAGCCAARALRNLAFFTPNAAEDSHTIPGLEIDADFAFHFGASRFVSFRRFARPDQLRISSPWCLAGSDIDPVAVRTLNPHWPTASGGTNFCVRPASFISCT
jgi:hypothetical protein